ncbi:PD-(D/E)XK nuclease family protein [Ligilactobacillus sp. WILCCON 0076]|uniref:PD-(D/E)XK nuclease family protein n=1 Tax=Ligilactobacillus ubinensis TaxID=2876789 RepID=A0A9X2JM55_9LACO|nr:PD-(D/E)XK nuclease family protein [Ligilactobacillus ubinensis]MCP0887653.1 PD-(D/E)XK nuclease family protein [Ligilactobacillus ubinensis]
MTLGFILGTAAVNHEQVLLEQLATWRKQNPTDKSFYIVPNHIKFETEVSVLEYLRQQDSTAKGLFATTNTQIFSFSRLAWYFLKDHRTMQGRHLTETGLTMIVEHILQKLDNLYVFSSQKKQIGFAKKLATQLLEIKTGGYTPENLEDLAKGLTDNTGDLKAKLHDLVLVYREFERLVKDDYVDSAKVMLQLAEYLNTADLSTSSFIITGFEKFTALEIQILMILAKRAKNVRISLIMDKKSALTYQDDGTGLFKRSQKIYHYLCDWAQQRQIPMEPVIFASSKRVSTGLENLANYWQESVSYGPVKKQKSIDNDVEIHELPDRIAEVRFVASQIRQAVSKNHFKYRDFLILTPDITKYTNLIEPVFKQYQIPLFMDSSKSMSNHPLVEFLEALFDLMRHRNLYTYQEMMRLLKTELFIPKLYVSDYKNKSELILQQSEDTFRETLDWLENYLLKMGINLRRSWETKKVWIVKNLGQRAQESKQELLERELKLVHNKNANLIKDEVAGLLNYFWHELDKVKTNRDFAKVLINFLTRAGVPQNLAYLQNKMQTNLKKQSNLTMQTTAQDATQAEQVWNTFCDLLDEYVLALGDEPFDQENTVDIFKNGFDSATYKQVPTTLDQVIFSKTSIMQRNNRKQAFIIGVNDDVMPAHFEDASLLTEQERKKIEDEESNPTKFLNERSTIMMANEPYQNYLAFMTPTKKLWFTYPLNDSEGELLEISPYVIRIAKAFDIKINKKNDVYTYIGTPRTILTDVMDKSRIAFQSDIDLAEIWRAILQYELATLPKLSKKLLMSLKYKNEILPNTPNTNGHKQLIQELVRELYKHGEKTYMFGSISRLENFYSNPYEFFLKYGLRLNKRATFEVTSADTGTYFHSLLDQFIKVVHDQKRYIRELSSQEFDGIMHVAIDKVHELNKQQKTAIFDNTARIVFQRKQLEKKAYQVAQTLWKQRKDDSSLTLRSETTFGFGGATELEGLVFPENQKFGSDLSLNLQGRIDRLDLVISDLQRKYLNVIDYKSGNIDIKLKNFLTKALNGLSLQLLTYLAVLQKENNQAKLIQMLKETNPNVQLDAKSELELGSTTYQNLFGPKFKFEDYREVLNENKNFEELFMQQYQYRGLFRGEKTKDDDLLNALDQRLANVSNKSYLYNLKQQKNGYKASHGSQILTLDQMQTLIDLDLLKIDEARKDIFNGVIDLRPFKLGDDANGLQYSDYQPIMVFDPLVGNEYKQIVPLTDTDAWRKIIATVQERKAIDEK